MGAPSPKTRQKGNKCIGLSFERPYLMAGLNLMCASFVKPTVNPQISLKSMDLMWIDWLKVENLRIALKSTDSNRLDQGHIE